MGLELKNISRSFGKNRFALSGINFSMQKGEILALLGESGSGKSTLLRIIAGFELPDNGSINLNGKTICDEKISLHPEKRNIGLVFQDYALFPHLNIEKNIAFGQKKNPTRTTNEWLELVGLPGMGKRYPHELSGGQQQRVAIARSLAAEPELLLLDEPFSNLDDSIRSSVRGEIRDIIRSTNTTAVFVTHDTRDCMAVADKVIVLSNGKLLQEGDPKQLYIQPCNSYVARIFGEVNIVEGEIAHQLSGLKKFGIRPQHIIPGNDFSCTVLSCRFDGDHYDLELDLNGSKLHFHSDQPYTKEDLIRISFPKDKIIDLSHES